jgi:hypothetical protein
MSIGPHLYGISERLIWTETIEFEPAICEFLQTGDTVLEPDNELEGDASKGPYVISVPLLRFGEGTGLEWTGGGLKSTPLQRNTMEPHASAKSASEALDIVCFGLAPCHPGGELSNLLLRFLSRGHLAPRTHRT